MALLRKRMRVHEHGAKHAQQGDVADDCADHFVQVPVTSDAICVQHRAPAEHYPDPRLVPLSPICRHRPELRFVPQTTLILCNQKRYGAGFGCSRH